MKKMCLTVNMQTCSPACFVWFSCDIYYIYICQRSTSWASWGAAMLVTLYQWRTDTSWLITYMILLPHMLAMLLTSLTVIQTAVLIMAALAVMCLQLPNISFRPKNTRNWVINCWVYIYILFLSVRPLTLLQFGFSLYQFGLVPL